MFLFWYPEDPNSDSSLTLWDRSVAFQMQYGQLLVPLEQDPQIRTTYIDQLATSHELFPSWYMYLTTPHPPPDFSKCIIIGNNIHCTCTFIMQWSVCKSIGRHCLYHVVYILNFMNIQVLLWGNDEPSFEFEITKSSVKVYSYWS